MSRVLRHAVLALTLAAGAAACNIDGVAASSARRFSFTDAAADTLGGSQPGDPRAIDVTRLAGDYVGDTLVLTLTFAQPIAPASASAANSLDGSIDFDLDEDSTTGAPARADFEGVGATHMGSELSIDLVDDGRGHVPLYDATSDVVARAWLPATFTGTTMTVHVPVALLADDDGRFSVAALVGNGYRPTDLLPNAGHFTVGR